MAKRLLLRDAENFSQDQVQRILGSLLWNLPVVGGVGTGYSAGIVGKTPTSSTGHMAVTANGTTMVLTMLPGWASVVRDAGASTYDPRTLFAESDANDTATVTSNATGSTRNDTVCLKIDMNTAPTSDGSNLVSFAIIAGAAGGGLSNAPADGNLYLPLANVAVANGATSISQGNVTDLRRVSLAMPGPILVPTGFGGGFAPSSYGSGPVKIDEQVLVGTAASIIFLNPLPTGFRHLLIDIYARGDTAAATVRVNLHFNNDGGANYDEQEYYAAATTNFPSETLGTATPQPIIIPAGNATAGYFGAATLRIPHYQSAVGNKVAIAEFAGASANLTSTNFRGIAMVKWRTTATPITRVDLIAAAGNFVAGSIFTLYGIP